MKSFKTIFVLRASQTADFPRVMDQQAEVIYAHFAASDFNFKYANEICDKISRLFGEPIFNYFN